MGFSLAAEVPQLAARGAELCRSRWTRPCRHPPAVRRRPGAGIPGGFAGPEAAVRVPANPAPYREPIHDRPDSRAANDLSRTQRSGRLVAAVHGQPLLQAAPAHDRPRQGHVLLHARGPRGDRRRRRPVVLQCRPQPGRDHRGHPGPGGRSSTSRRPSSSAMRRGFTLASRLAAARAGRPRPRLLLQFGLRGRRHGAEDRPRLLERQGPGQQDAPDRPRARLSRRRLRRHLGRRHRQEPQVLRLAAGRRRPPAPHL